MPKEQRTLFVHYERTAETERPIAMLYGSGIPYAMSSTP